MYESAKVATTQLHFEPTKPRLSQSSKRERWFHWLFVHHCFKYYLSLTDPHSETTMFVNILTQFLTFTTIYIYIYQYAAIVSDTSWHIFGHNIYLYIIKQIYIYIYIVIFSAICCVTHVETFFHILLTMAWPIFWGVVGYLCPDIFPTIILIQSPTDIMIYLAGHGNYINAEPNVFFVSPNFQTGLFLC